MDGLTTLRQLRLVPAGADIPIVMLTALTDPGVRREAMNAGAADYWIKSQVDFGQLSRLLAGRLGVG
jgi:CheY-like chemotaxis protein